MKYAEYLLCAEKHLKGCSSLLQSYRPDIKYDKHVWLELYYLSGYIIEGITVYSVYKLYNWQQSSDIQSNYDRAFTTRTGLDFYYDRKIRNVSVFPHRSYRSLSVQGHHFQDIVKNLLRANPSFNDIPYLGNGDIDRDVELLIDHWRPQVRYNYNGVNISLNQDVIDRLLKTCFTIYSNHI